MKRSVLAALLLVVGAALTHGAHAELAAHAPPRPANLRETLPSIEALELLSLSYESLVADYYWLKAISEFGTTEMDAAGYPNLIAIMQRVLALDPYFSAAYAFAGTALTVKQLDPRPAVEILQQGMRYRPDDWRLGFYLGFNAYYFLGDFKLAASALAHAAKQADAPPIVGLLATRIAAEAHEPRVGLALVEAMLATVTDPKLRATYEERQELLLLEVELQGLRRAVTSFTELRGRRPRDLDDLVRGRIVREIPAHDPIGGRYYLDARGEVQTTSDAKRLRLYRDEKEKKP